MARNDRRPKRSTEVARHSPVARHAATSPRYDWSDLGSSPSPVSRARSVALRANRAGQALATRQRRLQPSRAVSFGAWSLPPTLSLKTLQAAATCARRAVRREVLFANGGRRPGSQARRKHFTNRSCK